MEIQLKNKSKYLNYQVISRYCDTCPSSKYGIILTVKGRYLILSVIMKKAQKALCKVPTEGFT